jgi:hypothetical protein
MSDNSKREEVLAMVENILRSTGWGSLADELVASPVWRYAPDVSQHLRSHASNLRQAGLKATATALEAAAGRLSSPPTVVQALRLAWDAARAGRWS